LPANDCVGRHPDATIVCKNKDSFAKKSLADRKSFQKQLPETSEARILLSCLLYKAEIEKSTLQSDIGRQLTAYADERTIQTITNETKKAVLIPYRYFVPLNISVINSLQNLSSYYTDL
jgi:hypothetical protein